MSAINSLLSGATSTNSAARSVVTDVILLARHSGNQSVTSTLPGRRDPQRAHTPTHTQQQFAGHDLRLVDPHLQAFNLNTPAICLFIIY